MAKNLEGETIAAIATPTGTGGVGVVRISGQDAKNILSHIFKTNKTTNLESHRAYVGWAVDSSGDRIDRAIALFMKGPESYTGEDVAEISCHGSPKLLKEVLDMSIGAGARLAERGEFTKRALLNGKIDLTQAEAVLDMIGARTKEALRSASKQLQGGLSKEISSIKEKALSLLAHIEASIDFPDEMKDEPASEEKNAISGMMEQINGLLSTADQGRFYRDGVTVAIVGRTNVGKSSLMNAILKEERAIVTEVPGTTRDTIEEGVNINGIPVNLVDTAGIRKAKNSIEKLGIERTRDAIARSDIVVLVLDASQKLTTEDGAIAASAGDRPMIVALNKIDLKARINDKDARKMTGGNAVSIGISALKVRGIKKIERELYRKATAGRAGADRNVYINSRHKECLLRAKESLIKASESVKKRMAADFISIDLRAATAALGEITGEEAGAEVIDRIFERFCVGK